MRWKLSGPVLIREEKRLVLGRLYWNVGRVGDGKGHSNKLSLSVGFAWYDLWVGLFIRREFSGAILYLCLLPCFPIRLHWARSWGGSFLSQ